MGKFAIIFCLALTRAVKKFARVVLHIVGIPALEPVFALVYEVFFTDFFSGYGIDKI